MSFFGSLLKIIAIGAFFIASAPFSLAIGSTLATALRIGGAVLGYLGTLIDKVSMLLDRQALTTSMTLQPGTALPVVYGRGRLGAVVADWFVDTEGNDKILYMVLALAHGSRDGLGIAGIDQIWLDNELAVDGVNRIGFKGQLAVLDYQPFLGTTTQNIGAT